MKNFTNKIAYISFIALLAMAVSSAPKIVSAECWLDVGPEWINCDPGEASNDGDYDPSGLYGDGNNGGNNGGNDTDDLNVITISATNIDEDSATIRGEITSIDSDEDYVRFFEWGNASNDLDETSTLSGTTDDEGTFSMTISDLNDDDTYYYRACAENVDDPNDDDCGSVFYFTTDDDSDNDDDNDDNDNDNDNDNDYCDEAIVTTDATNITATSATLNGVVTNENTNSTTVWFQYGPTVALGSTTSTKTIYANQSIVSTTIYGLIPGQVYFFRMLSNDCGSGEYRVFITNNATVTSTVGTITTNNSNNNASNNNNNSNNNTGEVLFETIQYLSIDLVASAKDVRPGDKVAFEAVYENLSDKNLRDVVMVVDFPKEMTVTDIGPGKSLSSQQVEVRIPVLPAYTKGTFGVTAAVGARTPDETFLVSVLSATFDHPVEENTRVETINSEIIRVSSLAAPSQIAGVIAAGFFPTSFLGWIVLIAAIILLVYISRKLYKEREEEKKKKEIHHGELKIAR